MRQTKRNCLSDLEENVYGGLEVIEMRLNVVAVVTRGDVEVTKQVSYYVQR
jgi:hypothetical protein